ncbi:MAG: DUF11 domain-containing protein [Verrucomicrobia bacterium]|nr:DUF11 domain-containing protein [Verrucomicrobiota bacterium]MBI3869892.1 DUF11 domain-containing protein [Verrucomicrobiota bacterium]
MAIFWRWAVALSCLLLWPSAGSAQLIDVTAAASPDPVVISNTLSYSISLTNTSGITLTNLVITNTLAGSVQFLSSSTTTGAVFLVNSTNPVILLISRLTNSGTVSFQINTRPTALGFQTNSIDIAATNNSLPLTNLTLVSEVTLGVSDLGVGATGPAQTQLVGDQATYTIGVTNYGPDPASNIILSNFFGLGATVLSSSGGSIVGGATGTNLALNVGTLAPSQSAQLSVSLQFTNPGPFQFISSVFADSHRDTNSVNDAVTNSVAVTNALPGVMSVVSIQASPTVDKQTGLFTQKLTIQNVGATAVGAVRVTVTGLSQRHATLPDILFNAVGTNAGRPFAVAPVALAPGDSVVVTLEFFFPTRQPFGGLTFDVVESPVVSLGTSSAGSSGISLTRQLPSTDILIEFPATPGSRYTILYSVDVAFTSPQAAQPSVVAPGDRVQWIDSGPPKTAAHPSLVPSRYYRVLLVP